MPKLPGVNHLDAVRALAKAGFQIARQAHRYDGWESHGTKPGQRVYRGTDRSGCRFDS